MSRGTLDTVRRAVRAVVERTPELRRDPALRRRLAESMVRVCSTAAGLMEEEERLTAQIGRRASSTAPAFSASGDASPAGGSRSDADRTDGHRSDESADGEASAEVPAAVGARMSAGMSAGRSTGMSMGMSAGEGARKRRRMPAFAEAQAAGDFHQRTAVNSAAGVLRNVRDAIDFPGFVTSLISGVFQAMNTSTIQQLQAYADLLGAVGMSTGQFAATSITDGRAMDWAAQRFPVFRVVVREGSPPALQLGDDQEMPEEDELKSALDATEEEVSTIQEDELAETLLPLVKRKLARDRQSMLSTMLLMGMNRIVVDAGRIHASMNLQVDARSTAEQNKAEQFDTRVTTGGSASFGTGMWGASANMQATVGYVTSDQQFSREDIAVRAGLRSSVDVSFRTEPIALNRMTSDANVSSIRDRSMNPVAEHNLETLLTADERRTRPATFAPPPQLTATAPAPDSEEARNLRRQRDYSPGGADGPPAPNAAGDGAGTTAAPTDSGAGGTTAAPADAPAASPPPAETPAPDAAASPPAGEEH